MKHQWKFIVVLIAGVISLIFEFGLHASTLFSCFYSICNANS